MESQRHLRVYRTDAGIREEIKSAEQGKSISIALTPFFPTQRKKASPWSLGFEMHHGTPID